jgi:hypothetical protein
LLSAASKIGFSDLAKPRPGWKPAKPFPKGIGGNPRGKPKGTKDRTPRNVWDILRARGDKDPLDVLSQFASSEVADPNLRVQAATALAGYQHGKRPPLRWVEGIVGLKMPRSLQEGRQYLARLVYLVAEGRIDIDGCAAIRETVQSYIDAEVGSEILQRLQLVEEQVRAQAEHGGTTVIVESSMGRMAGTQDLIMPGDRPAIESKPNPWGDVPNVGATVDVTAKRPVGRPRKNSTPKPGPPKIDPEGS